MIHRFLILSVLNLACACLFAQGEWNNWIFGFNIGMNFQTNPPSLFNGAAIGSNGGMAVASDSSGQLLFYSNGGAIYNRNHSMMLNGGALLFGAIAFFDHPLYTAQSIEDPFKYYFFTKSFYLFSIKLSLKLWFVPVNFICMEDSIKL